MKVQDLRVGNLLQRKVFNLMLNNEDYYFEDVKVIGIHNYIYRSFNEDKCRSLLDLNGFFLL